MDPLSEAKLAEKRQIAFGVGTFFGSVVLTICWQLARFFYHQPVVTPEAFGPAFLGGLFFAVFSLPGHFALAAVGTFGLSRLRQPRSIGVAVTALVFLQQFAFESAKRQFAFDGRSETVSVSTEPALKEILVNGFRRPIHRSSIDLPADGRIRRIEARFPTGETVRFLLKCTGFWELDQPSYGVEVTPTGVSTGDAIFNVEIRRGK